MNFKKIYFILTFLTFVLMVLSFSTDSIDENIVNVTEEIIDSTLKVSEVETYYKLYKAIADPMTKIVDWLSEGVQIVLVFPFLYMILKCRLRAARLINEESIPNEKKSTDSNKSVLKEE